MPYSFALPTTSILNLADYLKSDSHPSLILAAATQRSIVRSVLKNHKRLAPQLRTQNLASVLAAIDEYIPYLLALDSGLSGKPVNDEEIDVVLQKEIEVEWRSPLATSLGTVPARVSGRGLEYEMAFVLHTRACIAGLQARMTLQALELSGDDRKETITKAAISAKDCLLYAESVHRHLSTRGTEGQFPPAAVDISPSTQSALSNLCCAEATLMVILSQDPYPAAVLQSRDKDDREWMYKARDIPKVRASLCGRLAIRAAEYAEKALSLLGPKIQKSFVEYVQNIRAMSKAKACRFLAIDAELGGKVGEAIAWLIAGKKHLGYKINETNDGKASSLSKLKLEWKQRREEKKAAKGGEMVLESNKSDEVRALELLEQEFNKTNDMVRKTLYCISFLTEADQSPTRTLIRYDMGSYAIWSRCDSTPNNQSLIA